MVAIEIEGDTGRKTFKVDSVKKNGDIYAWRQKILPI